MTTKEEAQMERFTLEEFGTDFLSFPSCGVNGDIMVFDTFQSAAEMAAWMLEGGAEEGQLPIVGILCHDHDPTAEPADPQSWSAGWAQYEDGTVTTHEGDYEGEPAIWKTFS